MGRAASPTNPSMRSFVHRVGCADRLCHRFFNLFDGDRAVCYTGSVRLVFDIGRVLDSAHDSGSNPDDQATVQDEVGGANVGNRDKVPAEATPD